MEPSIDTPQSPPIEDGVFRRLWDVLRKGYHINPSDKELYLELEREGAFEFVRDYIARLGYTLVRHPAGFYYIEGEETEFGGEKRIGKMAAFIVCLVSELNNQGEGVYQWMFPDTPALQWKDVDLLPVFATETSRNILSAHEIENAGDIPSVMRLLGKHGFIEVNDAGQLRFLRPIERFLDACAKLGSQEVDK